LTLKSSPKERKDDSKTRRRGSASTVTTDSTQSSSRRTRTSSHHQQQWSFPTQGSEMPAGVSGVTPEEGLDFLDQPTYPHIYAWVTPPTCIRFTTSAFKAAPVQAPASVAPCVPSPFGMLKSPAKFLPPPLPASYLAAHAAATAPRPPTGDELEELRQERYKDAVKELVRLAYLKGVPCDHLNGGVMGVRYVVEPTPLELFRVRVERRALDFAAKWRGDPVSA